MNRDILDGASKKESSTKKKSRRKSNSPNPGHANLWRGPRATKEEMEKLYSSTIIRTYQLSGDQLTFLHRNPASLRVYLTVASNPLSTAVGLSDILNIDKSAVNRSLKKLREQKLVRIGGWMRGALNDGDAAPKYDIEADKPDARKMPPKPKKEVNREYWNKNKLRHTIPKLTGARKRATPWSILLGK